MFEIRRLAKKPWNLETSKTPYLFSDISTDISRSERIALIGASGQGKSTLLRTLALFHTPDEGEMIFEHTSYHMVEPRLWRKQICYVAQQPVMLTGSVEENLRTASRLHGSYFDRHLVLRLLESAGLGELDPNKDANDLSGGEKQRIALIRSLLMHPAVLLLDEVTSSLDLNSTRAVEHLLQQWHEQEGTAMIWVTHELEQAARVSERTWFMANGTKLEDAKTTEFFRQPSTEAARIFIGHSSGGQRP